jgi:3-hydroxyacyl-CoA dehydrogenase
VGGAGARGGAEGPTGTSYRAAPLLRRLVWEGRLGRQTGAGFLRHDG